MSLVARCCRYSNPRCRQFPQKGWRHDSAQVSALHIGHMEDEPLHVCPFSSTLTCEVTQDFVRFRLAFPITPSDNRKRNLCWCDVTWVSRPLKSSSARLFVHSVFKLTSNKTLELHVTGPLYLEARGFPNGKRWWNPFRCMTSSWSSWKHWYS